MRVSTAYSGPYDRYEHGGSSPKEEGNLLRLLPSKNSTISQQGRPHLTRKVSVVGTNRGSDAIGKSDQKAEMSIAKA